MNKNKKIFLLLSTYLIILFTPKIKSNKSINLNNDYSYHSSLPYASYSNGDVYISNRRSLINKIDNENDIFIYDARNSLDPNMLIYNSYRIKDKKLIEEIITIMLLYEKQFPSNWNRSFDSMKKEWIIHNLCYEFGYKTKSTESVDLNNDDEVFYKSKILSKIKEN